MNWSRREFLKAAGTVALAAAHAPRLVAAPAKERFAVRECYCPAHFGNSYEAMWPREKAAYLSEMKWWGFNRYSDWAVATDVSNPYASDAYWSLASEQLARKKMAFRAAQELEFALNLAVAPNHVYLDQLKPEHLAKRGPRIQGQLICPSRPEARKVILSNFENWFADYARSGVRLAALTGFAYDYGGCACERCVPWILTWAKLLREVHGIAEKHHPGIEPWVCSWWWSAEEHRLFNEWAATDAPGWLKGMTLHLEYNQTTFKDVAVPEGCAKLAFVHIGYADTDRGNDIYWKWGPVMAGTRIPRTLDDIGRKGVTGFQAYSEGVFDDCNKALLAGLGSGRFDSAAEVMGAYAARYFGAGNGSADAWTRWLLGWGDRRAVKLPQARDEFETLAAKAKTGWRVEHWRSKLVLETLDRQIGTPAVGAWTPEELRLADQFWAEQEHLNRDVYRLGPLRHIFAAKARPPAWYDSWQKTTRAVPPSGKVPPEA